MNKGRFFFILLAVLIAIAGASYLALMKGVNMVRDGLLVNHPTIKNVIAGAFIEVDSVADVALTKQENEDLFALLANGKNDTSVQIRIPYHARYGIDMSFRNFRVFRDKETVEVWLPSSNLTYCELRFDRLQVNGKNYQIQDLSTLRSKMYEYFLPLLNKHKANQKAARESVTKAIMFYFMPYKFDLKLYIDNQQQELPVVPGVNKDVDSYIKENFGSASQ